MGNRFKDMTGYHSIIIAHGVIATIVFLGLVPISTLIIRYYSRWNPFWAFKIHAWCQILTLLLSTVVFVLGWFAVGPKRSLTNPHHGIGLAIYVMVIFQVLWGWFVHKKESKRVRHHVPLKLVVRPACEIRRLEDANTWTFQIHRWIGRALALLGIVQIPLGLTLYGSPKVLFILYAVGVFAFLVVYFILSYLYDDEGFHMASEHGSRYTGPSVVEEHHGGGGGGLGQALAGGAVGAGLASLFKRRARSRTTSVAYEDSRTSYSDEKYSDESSRHHGGGGWGKKILEIGALAGAGMLAKKWWNRRRQREEDTEVGRYKPAHSRTDSYTEDSLSRLEDGRPEPARPPVVGRPPSRPQSPGSSYYYNSTYLSEQPERRPSHGVRDALLGAGAFAAVKRIFSRNKDKADEEKRRLEDIRRREEEDEALQRANSKRRRHESGTGPYPQRRRPSPYTESDLTPTDLTPRPRPPPPRLASGSSMLTPEPMATGAAHAAPSDIPPIPPIHQELSGDFPSPERSHSHHPHHAEEIAAGAAAGAALGAASSHRRNSGSRRRDDSRHRSDHVESPPVSVKVKMHNDGRHVTLRRLTEEEAAAQREARRRERRNSRRRGSSAGSLSGDEGRDHDRWRRVEELERQQAEQIRREQEVAAATAAAASAAPSASVPPSSFHPSQSQISHIPPPPPVPPAAPSSMPYGAGSVTSPGTWTGTEASGSYANNRRRRRAERARARQERQQHGVEFE